MAGRSLTSKVTRLLTAGFILSYLLVVIYVSFSPMLQRGGPLQVEGTPVNTNTVIDPVHTATLAMKYAVYVSLAFYGVYQWLPFKIIDEIVDSSGRYMMCYVAVAFGAELCKLWHEIIPISIFMTAGLLLAVMMYERHRSFTPVTSVATYMCMLLPSSLILGYQAWSTMVVWGEVTFTIRKHRSLEEDRRSEITFLSAVILALAVLTAKYAVFSSRHDCVPPVFWAWYLGSVAAAHPSDRTVRAIGILGATVMAVAATVAACWEASIAVARFRTGDLALVDLRVRNSKTARSKVEFAAGNDGGFKRGKV
ncbi:hypothetical protein EV182_003289, partial [Spiromyces aspiralis]